MPAKKITSIDQFYALSIAERQRRTEELFETLAEGGTKAYASMNCRLVPDVVDDILDANKINLRRDRNRLIHIIENDDLIDVATGASFIESEIVDPGDQQSDNESAQQPSGPEMHFAHDPNTSQWRSIDDGKEKLFEAIKGLIGSNRFSDLDVSKKLLPVLNAFAAMQAAGGSGQLIVQMEKGVVTCANLDATNDGDELSPDSVSLAA